MSWEPETLVTRLRSAESRLLQYEAAVRIEQLESALASATAENERLRARGAVLCECVESVTVAHGENGMECAYCSGTHAVLESP